MEEKSIFNVGSESLIIIVVIVAIIILGIFAITGYLKSKNPKS